MKRTSMLSCVIFIIFRSRSNAIGIYKVFDNQLQLVNLLASRSFVGAE